jgi:hypothetical protein
MIKKVTQLNGKYGFLILAMILAESGIGGFSPVLYDPLLFFMQSWYHHNTKKLDFLNALEWII